ncbi:MAG: hypothetical protein LBE53_06415 [Paucimonas sp.]|nr:hypothetical protein [Paucimonas sp.]
MKKLVPDPPSPMPFVTIISNLDPNEAMAHANRLMTTLCEVVDVYINVVHHSRAKEMLA